jgi:hypothetical protein
VSAAEQGLQEVAIVDLVQHKAFQVRRRLDAGTIAKYAQGFKLDGPIATAPILVGRIAHPSGRGRGRPSAQFREVSDGALVLLAGFHRVAACQSIGRTSILARIVETTLRKAQWLAAESNMAHGLPLKGAELRAAFHAYLRAGEWRNPDGTRKSLREMGRMFGKHHETMREWMRVSEFKHIRDQYHPEERTQPVPRGEDPIPQSPEEQTLMTINEALRIARNLHPALTPQQRDELKGELEETLRVLQRGPEGDLADSATPCSQPGA